VRCFVIASAIIFALILVGHVARIVAEGIHTLTEPLFLTSSVLAVGMTGWALYLIFKRRS
jgi:hypothetical protein